MRTFLGPEFVGERVRKLIYGNDTEEGLFPLCKVDYDANEGGVVNSGTSLTSAPSVFDTLNPYSTAPCHIWTSKTSFLVSW